MIVTEQTKQAAQEVYDYIITHPEKHNQAHWVGRQSGESVVFAGYDVNEKTICNSTMCIAGTAVFLEGGIRALKICARNNANYEGPASRILGLNEDETNVLFYVMDKNDALDLLNAVAQGDKDKFNALADSVDVD